MDYRTAREKMEALILSSYESMYRMAFLYMKNEADAMDVVQDSVEKALKNADRIRDDSYMKTWLFRIVINTAIDEQRRQQKTAPFDSAVIEGREDQYRDLDTLKALEKLEEDEKQIILLRYCEDWKLDEIASYLQKNLSTVNCTMY